MPPTGERMDLHVHPALKARVLEECAAEGLSMNEVVTAALCARYGLPPQAHRPPRKRMGRPPAAAATGRRRPRANGQP